MSESKSVSPGGPYTKTPTGTPRSSKHTPTKGMKRGVTFKAGLVDKEIQRYAGPLLTKDEVREHPDGISHISFILSRNSY